MDIANEIKTLIGQEESSTLEYKAVLPPSKSIAKLICAFANADGGYIILGVSNPNEINGLSGDFQATPITSKAIYLLSPKPEVHFQYFGYQEKNLFVIKVRKSIIPIQFEGNVLKRVGTQILQENPTSINFRIDGYSRLLELHEMIVENKRNATNSHLRLIEHYEAILKLIDDLAQILHPESVNIPTNNKEGKILFRILFSSFVDNFEAYLSDLLYEIFLAKPEVLKSNQTVTIEEVLNCSDIQEFIEYWSKQKISKLQKGSVKGFIKENKQIRELNVIEETEQIEIEKILQIRHLFTHRNGVIDEKFLQFFSGEHSINTEFQISVSEFCDKLSYLIDIVKRIDIEAQEKYNLSCEN